MEEVLTLAKPLKLRRAPKEAFIVFKQVECYFQHQDIEKATK